MAREIGKADYIISNDADEFWVFRMGSIKHQCADGRLVVSARRSNMLPLTEEITQPVLSLSINPFLTSTRR